MTTDDARDPAASLGSQRPAWAIVHDNERLRDEVMLLRLTADERQVVELAIREFESGVAGYDNPYANTQRDRARVLRGILKRHA